MRVLRVGLAQINSTVGDFKGNIAKIVEVIHEARALGVDIIAFPELAVCGYPPEDLLFKSQFIRANLNAIDDLLEHTSGITAVVGFVDSKEGIHNAAALLHDGKLAGVYHKIFLPNYGVFDEDRYFQAGSESSVFVIAGVGIGVNVCEDIWFETGPATAQAYSGAAVIVNISASPYHYGKVSFREKMLATRAADNLALVVHTNLVGGQDELVFDGNSMVFDEKGTLIARGRQFEEDFIVADLDIDAVYQARRQNSRWIKEAHLLEVRRQQVPRRTISEALLNAAKPPLPQMQVEASGFPKDVYDALVLGTRDYIRKNGFERVVIGLSGGIDSSLVAAIAVDALGPVNVTGVSMPSRYSTTGSTVDAVSLANNLGIELITVPIENIFQSYLETLSEPFKGTEPDVTEENIQARIRGNILMAFSNKFGSLVLTTDNKSETATGYATLYGDMAGGFAVIKDVPKTMVYKLARYRNSMADSELIPSSVIDKAPSAELRPEQKDSDSLPPYELLDPILTAYVEEDRSIEQIVTSGFEEAVVNHVARLVDASEYKRRQAPPGIKITPKAFGRDRRLPITNCFKEC